LTVILLSESVKDIHRMVIRKSGGTLGALSEHKIQNCLDFPFYDVYGFRKHHTLFQQAAALLFAFVTFHPFTDGNKRTGLIVTQLFLTLNGYDFLYPRDTAEYVIAIASNEILSIRKISRWLKENSVKSTLYKNDGRNIAFSDRNVFEVVSHVGDILRVKTI
jgi:death on curing protein